VLLAVKLLPCDHRPKNDPLLPVFGFRDSGFGIRVADSEVGVWGSGFGFQDIKDSGFGSRVSGLGSRVRAPGCDHRGKRHLGFRFQALGFRIPVLGVRGSG
jgi:hypothetical protein